MNYIVFVFLVFWNFNTYAIHEETIITAGIGYPPYISPDMPEKEQLGQATTDMLNSINVTVEYQSFNNRRAYNQVKAGRLDTTLPWYKARGKEKHFFYRNPISSEIDVFFHRTDFNFEWQAYKDLKSYVIGGVKGVSYGKAFDSGLAENLYLIFTRKKSDHNKLIDRFIKALQEYKKWAVIGIFWR